LRKKVDIRDKPVIFKPSSMPVRDYLKLVIPPIVTAGYKRFKSENISFKGDFKSWEEALNKSSGFQNSNIFEAVRISAMKVKEGEAVYERDSVLFNKIEYSWPVLACLQNIALSKNRMLNVIDFGGSLGTSYFQNRAFLKRLTLLKWFVVEQRHYVECGKREFENSELKFEYTIDDVVSLQKIDCIVLSGVLQCLDKPKDWLAKIKAYRFDYILLDRTSFIEYDQRLMIETVPESIYHASFPCWFFNEKDLLDQFLPEYNLISDFKSADKSTTSKDNKKLYWKGFFFKRKY
jgi:putative methyltransferase (TIGR04325 family)